DVRGRDLVGANIDRSHAVGGRSDRDAKRPGTATLFANAQRPPATARPAKTEGDVLEIPFVAALLIVDNKVSVLQTDFIEILSVKPGQAQAVEPIEARKQTASRIAVIGDLQHGLGAGRRRGNRADGHRRRGLTR